MILHSAFSSKSQPLPPRNETNIKKVNFQTAAMVQHSKPNPLLGCWVVGSSGAMLPNMHPICYSAQTRARKTFFFKQRFCV